MKLTITTNSNWIIPSIRSAVESVPNPIDLLHAQQQLNKFRKLDASALRDMGLTQTDVDTATLGQFLRAPKS